MDACRHRTNLALVLLAVSAVLPAAKTARGEDNYWALLADGTQVTGRSLDRWDKNLRPRLGGRDLLDPRNPVRVLRHLARRAGGPSACVEMLNGDILPGRVLGFGPTDDLPGKPICLAVQPEEPLRHTRGSDRPILVRPDHVRRVTFTDAPAGAYRPGTILLDDGTALATQAVRWTAEGLDVLTSSGIRRLGFDTLGQVDMPQTDARAALIRALARDAVALSPDPAGPIVRLSMTHGAVVTCPLACLGPTSRWQGDRSELYVQPAWAMHWLRLPWQEVAAVSFRRHDEIPLSLLPADVLRQDSFTGFVWRWRRNRNLRGKALESGTLWADLGVGSHSYSELAFDLPGGATTLSGFVGLDRAVGTGGCVTLRVRRDRSAGRVLWQAQHLRGGQKPLRLGPVDCRGARRIVLVTEYAHRGRPAGADPGDIRDEVDWLCPLVRVEQAQLRRLAGPWYRHLPGMAGWSPPDQLDPGKPAKPTPAVLDSRYHRWACALGIPKDPKEGVAFTRTAQIRPETALLTIAAATARGHEAEICLDVDGTPLKTLDGRPYLHVREYAAEATWSLLAFQGKSVRLALRVKPRKNPCTLTSLSAAFRPVPAVVTKDIPFRWHEEGVAAFDTRGEASFRRGQGMVIRKGALIAPPEVARALCNACMRTHEITVEAIITPAGKTATGPARIISFSRDGGSRNFTLGQEGAKYDLRLRTTGTDENGTLRLAKLPRIMAGKAQHHVITYKPGALAWYVSGRAVVETDDVKGDFRHWDASFALIFGDEWKESRPWMGQIQSVNIYNRALSAEEAKNHYRAWRKEAHRRR